jgi:DNA gyrase subunit A
MKAHEVPEAGRSARGTPLVNLLQLSENERVTGAIAVDDFPSTKFLTLVTKQGTVKRTPLDAFSNVRSSGIIATQFDENDTLAEALITTGDGEVVIATSEGLAIRFNESDISVMGRTAKGVVGIRLDEGSEVVGACFIPSKAKDFATFMITKKGYGKKTLKEKYRLQKRGGYGVIALKVNSKTGNLVGILAVTNDCEVLTVSEKGQAVRLSVDSIANQGRASSGVRIARLDEGDRIASVAMIPAEVNAS